MSISRWRNESIKALGNAIVPQVALQIFKAISNYKPIEKETYEAKIHEKEKIHPDKAQTVEGQRIY